LIENREVSQVTEDFLTENRAKKTKLYEGKAKVVYPSGDPGLVHMVFKDDATAFNGEKRGTIKGKGHLNAQISAILFKYLEENGIPTHFVSLDDETSMTVKLLKILPIEVVVRNIIAGHLAERVGRPEGEDLPFPIIELYYKSDELGDPLLNDDHILALRLASREEIDHLKSQARKINSLLKNFFMERGLLLVDFKLEFGRVVSVAEDGTVVEGEIVLGDEISPDTCRFWDAETRMKLDKDRFRRDLGGVEEAYAEVLRRIS